MSKDKHGFELDTHYRPDAAPVEMEQSPPAKEASPQAPGCGEFEDKVESTYGSFSLGQALPTTPPAGFGDKSEGGYSCFESGEQKK